MKIRWQIAQWFELRWWKNYLQDKTKEEYLNWKRTYWKHMLALIDSEIKFSSAKTIVDIGCGPAGIFILQEQTSEVSKNFGSLEITAIDPLLDEYEKQLPFFKKSDYPNTVFVKSTIEEFTSTQKFDLVFCMNAINHVNDIEKGFETLKRICAEDGRIIVSIDAHNYFFFKYLFRLLPGDVLHPQQYSLKDYKKSLSKNGWKVSVPYLLKEEQLFNHYVLIARRGILS